MNTKNKFKAGLAVVFAMAVMMSTIVLATQHYYVAFNVPTGLASITNTTLRSTAGTAIQLLPNQDLAITCSYSCAGVGTSNTTFGFDVSTDNTNWTTTGAIQGTFTDNGTNTVTGVIQCQKSNLVGIAWIRFGLLITTHTNAVTVGTITAAYDY